MLKRVSILGVLITVIAVFAGCGKEATVVGTWEGEDYTYTFNDDGTGIQQIGEISVSITSYEAKDGSAGREILIWKASNSSSAPSSCSHS